MCYDIQRYYYMSLLPSNTQYMRSSVLEENHELSHGGLCKLFVVFSK